MIILAILAAIGIIVGLVAQSKKEAGAGWLTLGGSILLLLSFVLATFVIVPPGHQGVIVQLGKVTGRTLPEGLGTKMPFIEDIKHISIQTFKHEVPASSASIDLQDVATTIAINYHINPLHVDEVYRTLGHTDITEYVARFADPAIQETVKKVTAGYLAEDLILKRELVKKEIATLLDTWLGERWIEVETVSITDFQFSEMFTASIEAKVAAVQAVLEALNKLERVKVEAQQREAAAIGEANARIAIANGEAEYIRIVTAAQVAANESILATLTPEVLQYILLDRLGEDIKLMVIPGGQGLGLVLPQP
ncbi:hypothetical protein LCGC14_2466920 [marine sediment metagenome]|uniref:Band 7 domain-containing protein n=1 Tax=marine sediment metagenome TaxID=412755 RepID=A0A0F9BZA5_9ZZZZ